MGVPCVRIIDPTSRTGRQCIGHAWTAAETLEVPGTKIQVNLLELFANLDENGKANSNRRSTPFAKEEPFVDVATEAVPQGRNSLEPGTAVPGKSG
jgi:hypothetical protein